MDRINSEADLKGWKIKRTSPIRHGLHQVHLKHEETGEEKNASIGSMLHKTLPRSAFASPSQLHENWGGMSSADYHALLNKHADKLLSTDKEERAKAVDSHNSMISRLKDHIEKHFGKAGTHEKEMEKEYTGSEHRTGSDRRTSGYRGIGRRASDE